MKTNKLFMAAGAFMITAACTLLTPPDTVSPGAVTYSCAAVTLNAQGDCGNTATYTFDAGTLTISGTGSIDSSAFEELNSIQKVIINDGITEIKEYAFQKCEKLTQITIPASVTSIGNCAFNGSGLTSITLPENLTFLGANALRETPLKEITIPKELTTMCDNLGGNHGALYESSVETVTFEDGTETIPAWACHGAKKMTSVVIPDSVTKIEEHAFEECTSLKEISIPDAVTYIGNGTFKASGLTSLTLPENLTFLGAFALKDTAIKEITIPKMVTTMLENDGGNHGALYDSSVEKVTFEDGLETIPAMACHGASKLTSVVIPDSVTKMDEDAFAECAALKEISIPDSVTYIGSNAFAVSGLTSLTLPKNLDYLGARVLRETSVKEITIPKMITTMLENKGGNHGALYESSVETVTFEDGTETIPAMACHGALKLTSVVIPDSVTKIDEQAFAECEALKEISIPDAVTYIGSSAFEMSGLTSLTLPKNLTYLGARVLKDTAIKEITIPKTITTMLENKGGNHGALYESSVEKVIFEDGAETVPEMACHGASKLTSVVIPDSVTHIGGHAFEESGLTTVTLPKNLTYLGAFAFLNTSVKEITVPKTIITMCENDGGNHGAFCDSAIEKVTFEDGIQTIPEMACQGAKKLTSVVIPDSVTKMDEAVFAQCEALTEISIPDAVTYIGSSAFEASGLASLTLPKNLTYLGAFVLKDTDVKEITIPKTITTMLENKGGNHGALCDSSVEKVTFEDGLKTIPAMACQGAKALTSAVIPVSVSKIEEEALEKTDRLVVYAYTGSYAMNYAKQAGIPTVSIGQCIRSVITVSNVTKTASKNVIVFSLNAKTNGKGTLSYRSNNRYVTVNAAGTVTIAKNFAGTAKITVTVSQAGKYLSASKVVTVTVKPSSVKLKKLKKVKKIKKKNKQKLTVTWAKNTNCSGFEVQYATNRKFTKNVKKTTVKGNKKTSTTLKSLKKKKTYYVRVRTYKTTANGKIVSGWSNVKKIKM